jgi:hypothetical protein
VSVLFLAAALLAATAAAAPAAKPAPPRTGQVSSAIHSQYFKRLAGDKSQSFRVDYSAQLTWTLGEQKACFFNQCHHVCNLTISHKTLSRQIWWTPPTGPAVLAQNSPAQREYAGGVVTFQRPCASVTDPQVQRAANDRLRPYQFADEMIHDRPQLLSDADAWLHINPPPS